MVEHAWAFTIPTLPVACHHMYPQPLLSTSCCVQFGSQIQVIHSQLTPPPPSPSPQTHPLTYQTCMNKFDVPK